MRFKKKLRKKGDVSDNVYWIMNIALVAIVIFLLNLGLGSTTKSYADTQGLEYYLLNERILNSLWYTEPISQAVQPGIIDISDFNEKTINKTIVVEKFTREFGIRILLQYNNNEKEIYFNQDNYDTFRIFRTATIKKSIQVRDGEEYYKGTIEVEQAIKTKGLIQLED